MLMGKEANANIIAKDKAKSLPDEKKTPKKRWMKFAAATVTGLQKISCKQQELIELLNDFEGSDCYNKKNKKDHQQKHKIRKKV